LCFEPSGLSGVDTDVCSDVGATARVCAGARREILVEGE
jgi:hypothetical protein